MKVAKEFSEYEPWSGAVDTYELIVKEDRLEDLEYFLEDLFPNEIPDETEVNDLLWFDREYVLEALGIKDPYADDEDEEDEG